MLTLEEKFKAVDALIKIEILFKYYEDPIYLKALKYSRQQLQHEIAMQNAVNDIFVYPKNYKVRPNKEDIEELKEAMLIYEKMDDQYTNYGIIFQKGENNE